MAPERILQEADYQKLITFVFIAKENGTHFAGMTFEDGMEAVLDVIDGNQTADEVTEV